VGLALAPASLWAADETVLPPVRPAETNAAVSHPPRRLEEAELANRLTAALNKRCGDNGAEWELRFTRPWTAVTVPDEPLTVEVLEPALNRITTTCILRFELRAGERVIGSWQAPVQARLWREVLVARAALQRGQLLSETDFAHERRDVLAQREPLSELPADAAAYQLAESVPLGAPLTARAVRLRPVLVRGQTAQAIVREGAMTIALKVEVLEEGAPGQLVRVRNLQSRRELRGKVLDEKTIAITL
jgi:flagellar basal body P-ring formation protein FlgA